MASRSLLMAIAVASLTFLSSSAVKAQYNDDIWDEYLSSRSVDSADLYDEFWTRDLEQDDIWARDVDHDDLWTRGLDEDTFLYYGRTDEPAPQKKLSYAPSSLLSPLAPVKAGGRVMPHYLNPTSLCPEHKLVCVHAGKGMLKVPGLGHGDYRTCPTCGRFC